MPETRMSPTEVDKSSLSAGVKPGGTSSILETSTDSQSLFSDALSEDAMNISESLLTETQNSTPPGDLSSILAMLPLSTVTVIPAEDSPLLGITPTTGVVAIPLASSTITNSLVIVFGCISIFITVINVLLLVSSKFTSGGRTPVLIFVRSLCVADALTGIFGMLKMSQVVTTWGWINCFLPESILFSATIAFNLTHVMLATMCYSMLKDLLRFDRRQDKHRSIFSMTFLWNGSFVIGFSPHMGWNVESRMGWNSDSHICLFLKYFSHVYVTFVTVIIGMCIVWLIVVNIALQVLISYRRVRDPAQLTLAWPVIRATRVDIILQLACYIPGALYIYMNCESCAYQTDPLVANANLWLFMPLMVLRSACSTALHATRTPQIRDVISHSIKLSQYQMMLTLGLTAKAERPVRAGTSIFIIDTDYKNDIADPSRDLYKYSWRQVINGKLLHKHHSPTKQPNSPATHPVIPEEPSTSTLDQASVAIPQTEIDFSTGTASTPSQSRSNMTLVSSLGSSMQSSSNTNGTVSPKSSTSSGKLSAMSRSGNLRTLQTSHSVPSQLQQIQDPPSQRGSPGGAGASSRVLGRPYWVGSMPRRTSQPLLLPIENAEESLLVSSPTDTRSLHAHQRHLLWARSPTASRMTSSSMHTLSSSPRGPAAKKEALNNGSPHRVSDKALKANTVHTEVVVHVPADV